MKKIAICSLVTALLAGNVFSENVNVPFTHKAVPVEGLMISYNTYGTEKVICTAENFYKGGLSITKDGTLIDTGSAYGNYDNHEFYFTRIGDNKDMGDLQQFNVDKKGYIKLEDTNDKSHESFVSCFYVTDQLNK